MLMGVCHQQKLQYWAHREYKNPQSLMGLQILGCLISFHYIYVFTWFTFTYYMHAYFRAIS